MTRTRLGLLGLCAMVFGLMAIGASIAQAEALAKWLVLKTGGVLMTETEINEGKVSLGMEPETTFVLHSEVAGLAVLIECKKVAAVGAIIKKEGKVAEGAKIKLSECITKLNGVTNAPCKPKANKSEEGVINTQALHALIELHELGGGVKDDLLRFLPDTGDIVEYYETSDECAIGNKIALIGKLFLKDCEGLFLTHLIKHLVEVGPLTELWLISKTNEHLVTILGSSWLTLGGSGLGRPFSMDPA